MLFFQALGHLFIDLKSMGNIKGNIIGSNGDNLGIMNRRAKVEGHLGGSSSDINDRNTAPHLPFFDDRHTESHRLERQADNLHTGSFDALPDVADLGFQPHNNIDATSHGHPGHPYRIKQLILIVDYKLLRNDMDNLMIDIQILDIGSRLLQKPVHI